MKAEAPKAVAFSLCISANLWTNKNRLGMLWHWYPLIRKFGSTYSFKVWLKVSTTLTMCWFYIYLVTEIEAWEKKECETSMKQVQALNRLNLLITFPKSPINL